MGKLVHISIRDSIRDHLRAGPARSQQVADAIDPEKKHRQTIFTACDAMARTGELIRISRGYFRLPDAPEGAIATTEVAVEIVARDPFGIEYSLTRTRAAQDPFVREHLGRIPDIELAGLVGASPRAMRDLRVARRLPPVEEDLEGILTETQIAVRRRARGDASRGGKVSIRSRLGDANG